MIPRRLAQAGRRFFPRGVWEGPRENRWVSLTFDDGPHPNLTPQVLTGLERSGAPGAFFVEGQAAARHPELVRAIHAAGHEVGNHTWDHLPLHHPHGPDQQLARTEEILQELAPGSPKLFRPPFGWVGLGGGAALRRHGLTPVYWSVVPADWDPLHPGTLIDRVLRHVHPGAVVVLHAGRDRQTGAAAAIEELVERLRADAWDLVPLSWMAQHALASPVPCR